MIIKIGEYEYTECWDGVLYKKLSNYPYITKWEIQTVLDFIDYESKQGRICKLEADEAIWGAIKEYTPTYESGMRVIVPEKITECTACPKYKGCMTDFVCHTASKDDGISILDSGRLLSAVKARRKTANELKSESRNAAGDPEDYFDYVMFSWGNCQAGDRLVMERKLGRFPDEKDLSENFTPGIRFFFKYDELVKHPSRVFEGVLPFKIKDEVVLKDWIYAIIIPEIYRKEFEPHIPSELEEKVYYICNDCKNIWEWSEKVYEFVKRVSI